MNANVSAVQGATISRGNPSKKLDTATRETVKNGSLLRLQSAAACSSRPAGACAQAVALLLDERGSDLSRSV